MPHSSFFSAGSAREIVCDRACIHRPAAVARTAQSSIATAVGTLMLAAIQIGAPVLGALFLTEVALALAARRGCRAAGRFAVDRCAEDRCAEDRCAEDRCAEAGPSSRPVV